jgi:hypothetical protein
VVVQAEAEVELVIQQQLAEALETLPQLHHLKEMLVVVILVQAMVLLAEAVAQVALVLLAVILLGLMVVLHKNLLLQEYQFITPEGAAVVAQLATEMDLEEAQEQCLIKAAVVMERRLVQEQEMQV